MKAKLIILLASLVFVGPAQAADTSEDEKIFAQAQSALEANELKKAEELATPLAQKNYAAAQLVLGLIKSKAGQVEESITWYQKAALGGNAIAQNNLARAYYLGRGVAKNDAEAVKWWKLAADQGNASAQNNLSVMYGHGRGVPKDQTLAAQLCLKAAEQGEGSAMENIGMRYMAGEGLAQDGKEAMKWLLKAAEQKSELATYSVGLLYEKGIGTAANKDEAIKWYQKAAAMGFTAAQDKLDSMADSSKQNDDGVLLLVPGEKFSVKYDVVDGKFIHLKTSEIKSEAASEKGTIDFFVAYEPEPKGTMLRIRNNGDKDIQYDCLISKPFLPFELSQVKPVKAGIFNIEPWAGYVDQFLIRNIRYGSAAAASADDNQKIADKARVAIAENDLKTAEALLAPLGQKSVADAQNLLGILRSRQGKFEEAVDLYRKAAGQGNTEAQTNLSIAYARGRGVPVDLQQSAQWCKIAAEQGDATAQCNLGMKYMAGLGLAKDSKEAMRWFQKSAEQKSGVALYLIGEMNEIGEGVPADSAEAIKWYQKSLAAGFSPAEYKLIALSEISKRDEAAVLLLVPNDNTAIDLNVADEKVVHLRRRNAKADTIAGANPPAMEFLLTFDPAAKQTTLKVSNRTGKDLLYDCLIKESIEPFSPTDVLPVKSKTFNKEIWPGSIGQLMIRKIRYSVLSP